MLPIDEKVFVFSDSPDPHFQIVGLFNIAGQLLKPLKIGIPPLNELCPYFITVAIVLRVINLTTGQLLSMANWELA